MKTMMYPEQYAVLWRSSWLILIISLYASYKELYDISCMSFLIFLTSINHWRYPEYASWRRYMDICGVNISMVYMLFRAYNAQYGYFYYGSNIIGIYYYLQGCRYQQIGDLWYATYMHLYMHIVATIGHLVLYSGHMTKIMPPN